MVVTGSPDPEQPRNEAGIPPPWSHASMALSMALRWPSRASRTGQLVMTVHADPGHGARLRSLFSGLLGEPDLVSDGRHGVVDHAVVVEVDLPAIRVEVSPL